MFLANSGTEANEAALKLVRRHGGTDRPVIVAAQNSFHGRTMGSLSLTGKPSIRDPFQPFGVTVRFVPYGDVDALAAAVGPDTAAVFLEPCLGEGGVVPAPPGYLQAARAACDESGALLVLDEIQSGIGRTGQWFACLHEGIVPDVLTLAKGPRRGLPIGACIGLGACGTGLARGEHGSTFGGNPVSCAAALAVLDTIELGRAAGQRDGGRRGPGGRDRRHRASAGHRRPRDFRPLAGHRARAAPAAAAVETSRWRGQGRASW